MSKELLMVGSMPLDTANEVLETFGKPHALPQILRATVTSRASLRSSSSVLKRFPA